MPVVYFFASNSLQKEFEGGEYIRKSDLLLMRNDPLKKESFRFFFSGERPDSEVDLEGYSCRYEVEFPDFYRSMVECRDSLVSIWVDESSHSIAIARDAFGKIPLYYHFVPGSFLVFSNDLNDLLSCDAVRQNAGVNLSVVSSYLNDTDINIPYRSLTFFDSIFTVLPGHYVKFESGFRKSSRYLSFNLNKWGGLADINEYGDLFREAFTRSISRNVYSLTKVGAHLSGGLDSSSIVSLLCKKFPELDVHAFFVGRARHLKQVNKELEALADPYFVEEVREFTGVPLSVYYPPDRVVEDVIRYTNCTAQPLYFPNASLTRLMVQSIRGKGLDVMLSGHGGDNFVGYGEGYLNELWETRNWAEFRESVFSQASGDRYLESKLTHRIDMFPRALLRWHVENRVVQYLKSGNWGLASRTLLQFCAQLGLSPTEVLTWLGKRGWAKLTSTKKNEASILNKELLSHGGHTNRTETAIDGLFPAERDIYLNVYVNQNVFHFEGNYHVGKKEGVEFRYPFFDQDLYEVSLSVPSKLVFDKGRGRGHMRAGLKGILPESVRKRTGKYNLAGEGVVDSTARFLQSDARDFLADTNPVWHYVDKGAFWNNAKTLSNDNSGNAVRFKAAVRVYRVIYFSIWLDQYINRK